MKGGDYVAITCALCLVFMVSFGLAKAGEPRSEWLVCDVMNLCESK